MSFEMNKIAGAVLVAAILAMVSGILADRLVQPKALKQNAYVVATAEPAAKQEEAPPAGGAGPEPIKPLLASADLKAGQAAARVCQACHTFDKGGPNRVGPNLYGVVGSEVGHDRNGYQFSSALSSKGGNWTIDTLNAWLWKPQSFAKGTKMSFAGLAKAKDRADIIAYLNSLSDSPKPLASE